MNRNVTFTLITVALIAAGCLGCASRTAPVTSPKPASAPSPSQVASESPEAVIRAYWLAVGRYDRKTLLELSSTFGRQDVAEYGASWPDKSTRYDMSHLKVGATWVCGPGDLGSRPPRYKAYHAVREGTVEYVQLNASETQDAGPQMMFTTVVQATPSSPWRVEEIGTGP